MLDKEFDLGEFYTNFYSSLPPHLLALACYRYLEDTTSLGDFQSHILIESCAYKFCHMFNFSDYC